MTDPNAVEFAGQLLGVLRLEDDGQLVPRPAGKRLTPHGRELLEAMSRDAVVAIRRHAVQPGHTNIRLMRIWNLLALGDLAKPDARQEGEAAWREWRAFTRAHGLTEFLCPTYLGVSLDSLALIADHAPAIDIRIEADAMLGYAWRSAAAHWFGPAQRLSGPHARDYDYLYGRGYTDEHFVEAGWLTAPPRVEGAGWLPEAPRGGQPVLHLLDLSHACTARHSIAHHSAAQHHRRQQLGKIPVAGSQSGCPSTVSSHLPHLAHHSAAQHRTARTGSLLLARVSPRCRAAR